MANEQKKGLSTNSNAYTLIYAAVLVVIVAFLLSAVSSVLNDKKVANQKVDQKSQILAAINVSSDDVEAAFSQYVKSDALSTPMALSLARMMDSKLTSRRTPRKVCPSTYVRRTVRPSISYR